MIPLLLFIHLHLYCCVQDTPKSLNAASRVLQCAAAYKLSSSQSWAEVYGSMLRRLSLGVTPARTLSLLHTSEEPRPLPRQMSASSPAGVPQLLIPPPPHSLIKAGRRVQLRFQYSKMQRLQHGAEAAEQMQAFHERARAGGADVTKESVDDQKRFVPAGPNPLHNRR